MDRRRVSRRHLTAAGLYLHFPFCLRRCFYCHFYRESFHTDDAKRYLSALEREIAVRGDRRVVDTVYFGGGSPALAGADRLAALVERIRSSFCLTPDAEITVEINPEDAEPSILRGLRRAGFTRLSIGIQSFVTRDLRYLRRGHDAAAARRAVRAARAAGFTEINGDFIVSLPGQGVADLRRNFTAAAALDLPHLSVYLLEEVPEAESPARERRDPRLYHFARRLLAELGYRHYEVSNFCRPGHASRHNLKYWTGRPYLGFGAGAAGCERGVDYTIAADWRAYCAALEEGRSPERESRRLRPDLRRIVTGLRLLRGVPGRCFTDHGPALRLLLENGFLQRRSGRIRVPPDHLLLLNEILGYFMPEESEE